MSPARIAAERSVANCSAVAGSTASVGDAAGLTGVGVAVGTTIDGDASRVGVGRVVTVGALVPAADVGVAAGPGEGLATATGGMAGPALSCRAIRPPTATLIRKVPTSALATANQRMPVIRTQPWPMEHRRPDREGARSSWALPCAPLRRPPAGVPSRRRTADQRCAAVSSRDRIPVEVGVNLPHWQSARDCPWFGLTGHVRWPEQW